MSDSKRPDRRAQTLTTVVKDHHGGHHFGRARWMKFSHEEREKMREEMRRRHGGEEPENAG